MTVETTEMDSRAAARFVERYGRAWNAWDIEGFLHLFADHVIYAAHPLEVVIGRESLRGRDAKCRCRSQARTVFRAVAGM